VRVNEVFFNSMESENENENLRRAITLQLPRTLAFGEGCLEQLTGRLEAGYKRVFIITSSPVCSLFEPLRLILAERKLEVRVWDHINREPTVKDCLDALQAAREYQADAILGFGGGSALDVAKLVAALMDGRQDLREVFGIGNLLGRSTFLACVPTTAGTGSEVSPNAILLDEQEKMKKGVISPFLVPDVTCVDPLLTLSLPPAVTASTGMDALTHCIEAYVNRFSHPVTDHYALEGVRLIAGGLKRAYDCGEDRQARAQVALGSLYGGLCLGPVNTAAVHALAYPLGSEFRVAHGTANALLLPHVMEFNLSAAPARYAAIAQALGAVATEHLHEAGQRGLGVIQDLLDHCHLPRRLSELGVTEYAIPRMAQAALGVTRLIERNVRPLSLEDVEMIYRKAL
jgi:alcohol dehydrogenase class IV